MEIKKNWRLLLNEHKDENSLLIFSGYNHRYLINITIQSKNVDHIINAVLTSNWNAEKVINFLNSESEKILQQSC